MKPIQRIAVWIPNLSGTSGGAEIYLLNLAGILQEEGEVFILTARRENAEETVKHAFLKYEMPEFPVRYVEDSEITDRSKFAEQLLNKETQQHQSIKLVLEELGIDLFINGTYGNLCGFEGIRNWHIVHFPVRPIEDDQFKIHVQEYLLSYDHFFCNSEFTAGWFERYYGRKAEVLYPPIDLEPVDPADIAKKEHMIMTSGRIVPAKKLLEMVHAFRRLYEQGILNYRFVIAGLTDESRKDYLKQLKSESAGLPVELVTDLPRNELIGYYRKAKYYWHAMGLGVSEENPLKMEHFGMTTAEAMTCGCVPIVIDQGGQKEIVPAGMGLRFSTEEELADRTAALIRDPQRTESLAYAAVQSARRFGLDRFRTQVLHALHEQAESLTEPKEL
ncbi:MAG: glycosyltransferase family 4 protein [Solobacterium sp.]|nr:glycosyltransferase family 4 protein [Solobacterium sp.]